MEELKFKRGDILYFKNGTKGQVVNSADKIKICPWNAAQDLGSGKGQIHDFNIHEIPEIEFIERKYLGA